MPFERAVDDDGIATITIDHGKVNAMDLAFFAELNEALDACADDAAVVLVGKERMFSAGLNTKSLEAASRDEQEELLVTFGRTMHRVWLEPRPVVGAVTGHAVAGGTLLAMACDHAVAADGEFRWGLVETTIGFPIPMWAVALARGNVRADRLDDLILPGASVYPAGAVECGFADELAEPGETLDRALAKARELAQLPRAIYAETKRRLRGEASAEALTAAEADIRRLFAVRSGD